MGELRTRIEAKRKQIEAELLAKKADAQGAAADQVLALKAKLAELDKLVKGGWANLSDSVRKKLNDWLS